MLCAASQSAVGAMALMDLDSRQILQLEGNLLFIKAFGNSTMIDGL